MSSLSESSLSSEEDVQIKKPSGKQDGLWLFMVDVLFNRISSATNRNNVGKTIDVSFDESAFSKRQGSSKLSVGSVRLKGNFSA